MATDAMDLIRSTFLHAFFVQARGVVVRSPGSRRQVQFGAVRLIGAGTLPLDATDKAARLARRLSVRAHPDQAVRLARSNPPLVRSMADAYMVTSVFRLAACCKELLEVSEDAAAAASLWGIGDLPLDLAAVQIWRGPALLAPAGVPLALCAPCVGARRRRGPSGNDAGHQIGCSLGCHSEGPGRAVGAAHAGPAA